MYVARCKRIFIFIGVVYECVWGGGGGGEANITIRMTKTEGAPYSYSFMAVQQAYFDQAKHHVKNHHCDVLDTSQKPLILYLSLIRY